MAEQRPSYFLPARCAYFSHFHFNSSSTSTSFPLQLLFNRGPPASRELCCPIHVGVALPKQMRPLTCTSPLKGNSRCGRRHHSQILSPGLLSSTGAVPASKSYPFPQQDRI